MTTDLILAVLHHILAFGMAGILAAELASVRSGLDGAALARHTCRRLTGFNRPAN